MRHDPLHLAGHRTIDALLLVALVTLCMRAVRRCSTERRQHRSPAAPEHIQTWEGEGGGVPVGTHRTAAQVTP